MKIPLHLPCSKCKRKQAVFVNLKDSSFQWKCICGEDLSGSFANNATTGVKLLWKSRHELMEKKDFNLSIVFSAMAIDCELSRLYFKWRIIAELEQCKDITNDVLEDYLRNKKINEKFEEVAKLMYPQGLSQFVNGTDELRCMIEQGFPSLTADCLSKSFQKNLFWPRNRILHLGDSHYRQDDASRCFNIATLGMRILELLDENKRIAN